MNTSLFEIAKVFKQPEGEGWAIFNLPEITPETTLADFRTCGIERLDEEGTFPNDFFAELFVINAAGSGSEAHQQALLIHDMCDDIRRALWGLEYSDNRIPPDQSPTTLQAPNGAQIIGTFEILTGIAGLSNLSRSPLGAVVYDHTGDTEVDWDSQRTQTFEDQEVFIDENHQLWLARELVERKALALATK